MSKLSQCIEFIRESPANAALSNDEIAERFGTMEATPRRARVVIKAEALAASGGGSHGAETAAWLAELLRASEAEELIRVALADVEEERKELKVRLKDMAEGYRHTSSRVRVAFTESYPLWERDFAATSEPEEEPAKAPRLATATA